MKVAAHIEKFRRLDSVLPRFDPVADSELWIWTAMNACTHLLNAALHRVGATEETDSFHTQSPGLYVVPDRASGTINDSMHAPGDVLHFGQPRIDKALPANISSACEALRSLESLRATHVRGSGAIEPGMPAAWQEAYRQCVAQLSRSLDPPPGSSR